ncbi:MAG: acyltransferase [Muribaculaceae bacterium]|nr:acyltransferase [Muribaculaceae bacterium]
MDMKGFTHNRKVNLDCLKALMALMIVHCHSTLQFPEGTLPIHDFTVNLYVLILVPCFCFISGYFSAYTSRRFQTMKILAKDISRKFQQYVVPAIVFTLIPLFSDGIGLLSRLQTAFYFLPSLFLIIVCYRVLNVAVCKRTSLFQTSFWVFYGFSTTILMYLVHDLQIDGYFHWRQALHHNLFFIFGVVIGINQSFFASKRLRVWSMILSLFFYVVMFIVYNYYSDVLPNVIVKLLQRIVLPLVGIVMFVSCFICLFNRLTIDSFVGKMGLYIGQRSLALYVLQNLAFMIVFSLIDVNASSYPELLAVFTFLLSTCLVLIIHDMLCALKYIEKYVFGRTKPLLSFREIFFKAKSPQSLVASQR